MFDPMPQPRKRDMPPSVLEFRAEQNTRRLLIVSVCIVLVASLALLALYGGLLTGVICDG